MSPDSVEGNNFCEVYDIVEYPTIIALSDSGQLQNLWRGLPLPTISEVSFMLIKSKLDISRRLEKAKFGGVCNACR